MSDNKILNIKKDNLILFGVTLVTLASIYITYYISSPAPVKIIVWILWLVMSSSLILFSTKGKEFLYFFNESKIELQKVSWPNRQETIQTTIIVMIMVSLTGFILWAIDSLMMSFIAKITHLG